MNAQQINDLWEISNILGGLWAYVNQGKSGMDIDHIKNVIEDVDNKILHDVLPENWEATVAKSEGRFPMRTTLLGE